MRRLAGVAAALVAGAVTSACLFRGACPGDADGTVLPPGEWRATDGPDEQHVAIVSETDVVERFVRAGVRHELRYRVAARYP